jgi:ribosomal protein L11 methyltransferase
MDDKTSPPATTRIEVLIRKGADELLPYELYETAGSGLWIEEKKDGVLIKCYPKDVEAFLKVLHTSGLGMKEVHIEKEEVVDYAEMVRKYFRPVKVGDVTIVAPWTKTKVNGRRIVIEPGMAFGTGRHESTVLMLRALDGLDLKGKKVVDLGCGSGILALYAALLGAGSVTAVDNDIDAVLSARRNASLNKLRRLQLVCAGLQDIRGAFDVVLANLDKGLFQKHGPAIEALVKKGGRLVISGILKKDRQSIPLLFGRFALLESATKNSWCSFVLGR